MIKGIENYGYREGSIKKSQLTKRQASYKGPSLMKLSIYDDKIDAELHDINMRIIKAKKENNVILLEELVEMKEKLMLAKKERINVKTIRNTEPTTKPITYSHTATRKSR